MAKAIVPRRKVFDTPRLARAIENGLTAAAEGAEADFETTTLTWDTDVTFTITVKPFSRIISTDNLIYLFVSGGTDPHTISPKPGGVLTWMGNAYRAKTRPGVIGSSGGGNNNTIVYTAKPVQHPGTAPRNFDHAIKKKWERLFGPLMQRAIDAAVT